MQVAGLLQKGSFDRQPVALDQAVAADDLKVGVHMHRRGTRLVESHRVEYAWMPDAGTRPRQLQAIFEQGCVGESGITWVDEEIDVFCSRKRLFKADIAFPVTVANAFLLQRFEETPDSCLVRDSWSGVVRLNRYSFSRRARGDRIAHLNQSPLVTHRGTSKNQIPQSAARLVRGMALNEANKPGIRCRRLWIKTPTAMFQVTRATVMTRATPVIPNDPIISMQA